MKSSVSLILLILFSSLSYSQIFDVVWETERVLKTPESVYYDADRDQIYVSNINGKPLDKDGNGFITLLARDGSIKTLKWVTGINAPKGMVVKGDMLYVTDIDRFHAISIPKASIVRTYDVEGAQFLNDMTIDDQGRIYISDMSTARVHRLKNDTLTVWMEGDLLEGVNGLTFKNGKLMVGTKNQLLKVDPESKNVKVFIKETGPIDGLVALTSSKYVISDWSGRIQMITPTEKFLLGNSTDENIQAADLGYIPEDKLILIPTFFDNRVVARKLP